MHITKKKEKYKQMCRIMDTYNSLHNFCDIKVIGGKVTCRGEYKSSQLCCIMCHNLTKTGCRVLSLSCKLSYCYFNHSPMDMGLTQDVTINNRFLTLRRIIKSFAKKHNIPLYTIRLSMNKTFEVYTGKYKLSQIDMYKSRVIKKY